MQTSRFHCTGAKQTECTIVLHVISMGIKLTPFKCIFEETMLKLAVNFANLISQEPIYHSCLWFWFYYTTIQWQMLIKFATSVSYLSHWKHTQELLYHLRDHPIRAIWSVCLESATTWWHCSMINWCIGTLLKVVRWTLTSFKEPYFCLLIQT